MIAPGTMIAGRYRIRGSIGEGGHGAVFRAEDLRVGRDVAIKLLHPSHVPGEGMEARFEQEALLTRSLQHPNTVRLLDMGRTESGAAFIVYELLAGASLRAVLDHAGALPEARVRHIGVQVLRSLMEAHERGIIHRDIKPSNILLCQVHGDPDFVKVIDFGIAKTTETVRMITRTGFAIGTPSYMAPEQVRGGSVTPATDVYALGLVLAEALSGRLVMTGPTDAVVAAAQLSNEPVPLPPEALRSSLGPALHRATQKQVERRYANAQEMLADLGAAAPIATGAPISAEAAARASFPTGVISDRAVAAVPVAGAFPAAHPKAGAPKAGKRSWLVVALVVVPVLLVTVAIGVLAVVSPNRFAQARPSSEEEEDDDRDARKREKRLKPAATASAAATAQAVPTTPRAIVPGVLGAMTRSDLTIRLLHEQFQTSNRKVETARLIVEGTWLGKRMSLFFTDNSAATFNHIHTYRSSPHIAFHEERGHPNRPNNGLFVLCEESPEHALLLLGQLLGKTSE